jgi:hypothetical protein
MKSTMTDYIGSFFSTLAFTRVDQWGDYTVYAAKIYQNSTSPYKRYALVLVHKNHAIGIPATTTIDQINYKSIQTRELDTDYKIKPQKWAAVGNGVADSRLDAIEHTASSTIYKCAVQGYRFEMANNTKKQTIYQHPNILTISTALDRFACVITKLTSNEGVIEDVEQ